MRILIPAAVDKALGLALTKLQKINGVKKPVVKFLCWLLQQWLVLPWRHNFSTLARFGGYSERAIRDQFSKKLPFLSLFHQLFGFLLKKECIAVFDPTYISKSGKKTYGLDKFRSGTAQKVKKGLEGGCLAIVDTEDHAAYSMEVVQTPSSDQRKGASLIDHYVSIIKNRVADIKKYAAILAVDGYFMKQSFIHAVTALGLEVITKGRGDANMRYLYKGPQKGGKGRKKAFDGKVDWKRIDKRRWKKCYEDDELTAWELVLWSVTLKRKVKAVYVESKGKGSYQILISTGPESEGHKVLAYYRLRFGIEFLIRDAKSHSGPDHCQARSEGRLYNHLNMAMFPVSVVRAYVWAPLKAKEGDMPFSMRAIKSYVFNKLMADTIFSNLGLELSSRKIKNLYNQCLNFGLQPA